MSLTIRRKWTIIILFFLSSFLSHSQNSELKNINIYFSPSFQPNSELKLNYNKLIGIFEIKKVPIVRGNYIKKENIKHKFTISLKNLNFIYQNVNIIYKELKESKNITTENKILKTMDIPAEDGMTVLFELKFKKNERIKFEIGNNYNKKQAKLLTEIFKLFKQKMPSESEYLDELIENF